MSAMAARGESKRHNDASPGQTTAHDRFDATGITRRLVEEADEDRVFLFRDGVVGIVVGLATPFAPLLFLWLLTMFLMSRGLIPFTTIGPILQLIAAAIALLFVVSLFFAWRDIRPLDPNERGSCDPRFGRPTAKAGEAEDETFEEHSGVLGWSYAFFTPHWVTNFLSLGSRQFVQGIRSLVERSRLCEERLATAAGLMMRCGGGVASTSLPEDSETLAALRFLWSHRLIRAEGVLKQTRLLPTPKGLDLLNGHRVR